MQMARVYSTDLIGVRESVVDELLLLNPLQTPMIQLLGFGQPVTNVEHAWFEDEMFPQSAKVVGAKLATDTSIVVDNAEPFRAGQVVKIGDELIKVTAVNTGTKTLTVVRGHAGTTAAAIADQAIIEVMFNDSDEGQDARAARYKPRKRVYNLTQIFDDTVELSGTAMAVSQYGVDDEYEKEKQKKLLELALQLEKSVIGGVKYESGTKRLMGGMKNFIQTNIIDGGGNDVTDAKLVEAFKAIFNAGGMDSGANYKIIASATQKVKISNIANANIRIDRQDNGRGQKVDHYVSDFGAAEIILNKNLAPDEILIIDANRASIRPLQGREFAHTYMGLQGDYMRGMIVGEYTLEFFQEAAHARIKNLKTT